MHNNKLIIEACLFAAQAHKDQRRKYSEEPYINHPLEVASLVARVEGTPEMIAAAVLHDVIEDCEVTAYELDSKFGTQVAELVLQVTDVSRLEDGNRSTRKKLDRLHISKATPEGKTLKLADLISNSRNIMYKDPEFAKVYMREKRDLLEVLTEGNSELYREATKILTEYFDNA